MRTTIGYRLFSMQNKLNLYFTKYWNKIIHFEFDFDDYKIILFQIS